MAEMKLLKAIASDNLISRNRARTPLGELPMLAQCLQGKPCTTDHNTYNVEKEWATIARAWVEKVEPPPGLDPLNSAVVAREGYYQVMCELSVPDDSPHLLAFDRGLRLRVSIQFMYTYPRCPGCTCGENYWHRACLNSYADIDYLERIGVTDAYELSLVVVPAVTAARVLV